MLFPVIFNLKSAIFNSLVVARHGLDGRDDLFVRYLICRAHEARVAAVHQNEPVPLGVAAQGVDELPSFQGVEGTEIHDELPSKKEQANS